MPWREPRPTPCLRSLRKYLLPLTRYSSFTGYVADKEKERKDRRWQEEEKKRIEKVKGKNKKRGLRNKRDAEQSEEEKNDDLGN